jgi:hypothetical protein
MSIRFGNCPACERDLSRVLCNTPGCKQNHGTAGPAAGPDTAPDYSPRLRHFLGLPHDVVTSWGPDYVRVTRSGKAPVVALHNGTPSDIAEALTQALRKSGL